MLAGGVSWKNTRNQTSSVGIESGVDPKHMTKVVRKKTLTATAVSFRVDALTTEVHVFVSRDLNDLWHQEQDYSKQLAAKHGKNADDIEIRRLNRADIDAETGFTTVHLSKDVGTTPRPPKT